MNIFFKLNLLEKKWNTKIVYMGGSEVLYHIEWVLEANVNLQYPDLL